MRRRTLAIALLGSLLPLAGAAPAPELVVSTPEPLSVKDGAVTARIYLDQRVVSGGEASLTRLAIAAGTELPAHAHPGSLEVVYVLSGEAEVVHAKGATKVAAGDAMTIPAGAVHGVKAGPAGVEVLQMYLVGGPEQRYRDPDAAGTVPAGQNAVEDGPPVKVVPGTSAPVRTSGGKEYHLLVEEAPFGRKSCDLDLIRRPAGQKADVHGHDGVSELIYVLSGTGRVTIDGKSWDVAAGAAYYTPEGSEMGLASTTALETLLLVVNH